jgi:hypothetical protein
MRKEMKAIETAEIEPKTLSQKEADLKGEAWNISKILFQAQENLKILAYLMNHDPEVDVYVKHLDYFWRTTISVYSDHVLLKLNILFTPNEDFSINKLLLKLKSGGEFQGLIDDQKILEWEAKISAMNATYKKISLKRNKIIAHADRNPGKKIKEDITLSELKNIVIIVQQIVKDIYFIVAQASFMVDDPIGSPVESLKVIMRTLDRQRREELKPLFHECRKYGLEDQLPKSEQTSNVTAIANNPIK